MNDSVFATIPSDYVQQGVFSHGDDDLFEDPQAFDAEEATLSQWDDAVTKEADGTDDDIF